MKIKDFDLENDILIIAEIGNNHEGNFDLACRLVDEAAKCGVNAVKFQTYKTELFISKQESIDRFNRLKRYELSQDQFLELSSIAHKNGLIFISTPLDLESAQFLEDIVDAFKIASGDITFYSLLEKLSKTKLPLILSTGASSVPEIRDAISVIESNTGRDNIKEKLALLHCVSCYPVPDEEINLLSIQYLHELFSLTTGFSDHTLGINNALYASILGARIIEKHFTLNKKYSEFRDHQLSADPHDMKQLVINIKKMKEILGKKEKIVRSCEKGVQQSIRRSITIGNPIKCGDFIKQGDILYMRPGTGIPPSDELNYIGKSIVLPIESGNQLTKKHLGA